MAHASEYTERDTETESERARERPANTHEGDSARVAQVIVGQIEARHGVFLAGK